VLTGKVTLTAFESCDALEQYVEDQAVTLMKAQLSEGNQWGVLGGGAPPEVMAGGDATNGPTAYTKTNVQVAGVDEADFVKTDGTTIFALVADRLHITKSWPASELALLASVALEGYPSQMFLDEDRQLLVVLGSVYAPYAARPAGASIDCLAYGGCGEWAVATKATVIDVADRARPEVTAEIYLPGWYQNARRIGGSVRLVLNDALRWPAGVRWWPEYDPGIFGDDAALRAALRDLIPHNERVIRAARLEDWLPHPRRRLADQSWIDLGYDCRDFFSTNAPVDLGFTTVATLELDRLTERPARTSIIASASEVYASHDALYLAARHWWWWPALGQADHTYLFKFDLRAPGTAPFLAGGGVPGHILNQFSLDEHQGALRVATTISRRVADLEDPDNEWGRIETTNKVQVLRQRGAELEVVGATADLAKGERIQSARFLGDRGFVVTFRQVDPLFALDLSNPENPLVVGELKVPGFSSYLHPLDANHLLALGVHLPDPGSGQVDWNARRMKLSIFDVSDLSTPVEKHSALIGTAYGWSEALWEHKAFNYFPERGLLAIPFSDYRPSGADYWGEFVSDLRVFDIDVDAGISLRGALSMADVYQTYGYQDWTWSWSPWIRRSVMADEFVYAVSDAGIRVAREDALGTPIKTVTFDRVMRFDQR
jgi:hypothetical protein